MDTTITWRIPINVEQDGDFFRTDIINIEDDFTRITSITNSEHTMSVRDGKAHDRADANNEFSISDAKPFYFGHVAVDFCYTLCAMKLDRAKQNEEIERLKIDKNDLDDFSNILDLCLIKAKFLLLYIRDFEELESDNTSPSLGDNRLNRDAERALYGFLDALYPRDSMFSSADESGRIAHLLSNHYQVIRALPSLEAAPWIRGLDATVESTLGLIWASDKASARQAFYQIKWNMGPFYATRSRLISMCGMVDKRVLHFSALDRLRVMLDNDKTLSISSGDIGSTMKSGIEDAQLAFCSAMNDLDFSTCKAKLTELESLVKFASNPMPPNSINHYTRYVKRRDRCLAVMQVPGKKKKYVAAFSGVLEGSSALAAKFEDDTNRILQFRSSFYVIITSPGFKRAFTLAPFSSAVEFYFDSVDSSGKRTTQALSAGQLINAAEEPPKFKRMFSCCEGKLIVWLKSHTNGSCAEPIRIYMRRKSCAMCQRALQANKQLFNFHLNPSGFDANFPKKDKSFQLWAQRILDGRIIPRGVVL